MLYSPLSGGLGDSLIHYFSADFLFSSEISGFLVYIAGESCNYQPRPGIFSHCHSFIDSWDKETAGLQQTLIRKQRIKSCLCEWCVDIGLVEGVTPPSLADNNPDITPAAVLSLASRARANICTFGIYWLDQTSDSGLNKDVDNEDWGALNAAWTRPCLASINQMALTLRGARGDLCGATPWLLH